VSSPSIARAALAAVVIVVGCLASVPAEATKPKKAGKASKAGKAKRESRVPTKSTPINMPAGWTWPPSRQMTEAGQACEAKLDDRGVRWEPAAREGHVVSPIIIPEMQLGGVTYSSLYRQGPFVMDCQLAIVLETYGEQLRAVGVREIKFGRIYGWTKVRYAGKTRNALSRHGLGLAMDIVSVIDDDGREAVLARDYKRGDQLLLGVEKVLTESHAFRAVLSPKNDPISHKDHFHVEVRIDFAPPAADAPGEPGASDDLGEPDDAADGAEPAEPMS
jgi:hypothetical protein